MSKAQQVSYKNSNQNKSDKTNPNNSNFKQKVLDIVSLIPKGKIMTYKDVAIKANSEGAARAVGTIMKSNYDKNVPCHRVIRSDGRIGDYNRGGQAAKIKILRSEGVIIKDGRVML